MTYSSLYWRRAYIKQRRDIKWTHADTLALIVGLVISLALFVAIWAEWLYGKQA